MRRWLVCALCLLLGGSLRAQAPPPQPTIVGIHRSTSYIDSKPSCQFHFVLANAENATVPASTVSFRLLPYSHKQQVVGHGSFDVPSLGPHETRKLETQPLRIPAKGRYILELTVGGTVSRHSFTF
ncbi:MAG TPA: hypothetical protein VGO93_12810 [Candidatus Xenobia bacterium]|jgi:hypothetical protein